MRRHAVIAVLVSLALAGCGGSSSSSSSRGANSSASASASTTSTTGSVSSAAPSSSTTSAAATSTTATSTRTSTTKPGPDTHVHLAAKLTIEVSGVVIPPAVEAPAHTTIDLSVTAADGQRHRFVLGTAPAHTLAVTPGRPARLVLKGLRDGDYLFRVDGLVRGRLIVGAAPGP